MTGLMVLLFDTVLPADTVEVLRKDVISVGTYLYDETTKSRSGYLDILKLENGDLHTVQRIEGPGVLDVQWRVMGEEDIYGAWALSDGAVSVGRVTKERLTTLATFSIEPDAITMACDLMLTDDGYRIATAMSSGHVILHDGHRSTLLKGHDLEAWTVAFDPHKSNLLHSGGDDAKWLIWDLRTNELVEKGVTHHQAGVTTIQPHPTIDTLILTGSYDKEAALWDCRNLQRPLRTISVRSGVWKCRWHPSGDLRALAACMYDGFYVFDMATGTVLSKYDPGALSYGCAWLDEDRAVTCSFYDHNVQIWNPLLYRP